MTNPTPQLDRLAQAVTDVQQMHLDLATARLDIGQLKADLARAEDRILLLTDERARFRKEGNIYRDKLIELATDVANVGLLCRKAEDVMASVKELLAQVDGYEDPAHVEEKKASMAASLAAIDAAITREGNPALETVHQRSPLSP